MTTTTPTLTPYDYQLEAVDTTLTQYLQGKRRVVLGLPTGAGKTQIAKELIGGFVPEWRYALFLVPIKDLVIQTKEDFTDEAFISHLDRSEIGLIQGQTNQLGKRITIATVQTLLNPDRLHAYLDSIVPAWLDLIFTDEAHKFISKEYMALIERLMQPETLLVGMTATPYRQDRQSLKKLFWDDLCYSKDIWELIRKGYLADIEAYDISTDLDLSSFQVDGELVLPSLVNVKEEDEADNPLVKLLLSSNRYEQAYANWMLRGQGMRTLIFGQSVKDAYAFEEYFTGKGIPMKTITSKTSDTRRKEYYEAFINRELHLSNYMVLTTGNNLPVECLIMGNATDNIGLFTQVIGRGLRLGKEKLLLLNLTDKHHTLVMFDQLFGTLDEPAHVRSVRQAIEEQEKSESDAALPSLVFSSITATAQDTRSREYNPLIGDGWNVDTVTGNWSKQWGKYTVTAERVMGNRYLPVLFDGQRHFTLSEGKRTITQLDAQVLCQRELAKKQQLERLRRGESQQSSKPIPKEFFQVLRTRRVILRTREKDRVEKSTMTDADYDRVKASMTLGDFYTLDKLLRENGNTANNRDTGTLVGYVVGQGPQMRHGKWATGT